MCAASEPQGSVLDDKNSEMDSESVDSGFADLSAREHLAEASTVINPELQDQSVVDAHLYNGEPDVANMADFDDEEFMGAEFDAEEYLARDAIEVIDLTEEDDDVVEMIDLTEDE